jgi:hypothetical protein
LTPDTSPEINRQSTRHAVPRDVEAFLKHWQAVPKTGLMPTLRAFLDARPFKHQSDVAIADIVGPKEMRFRLFGSGLSTLAGVDLTGSDVLSNFHPDARTEASRMGWSAVTVPCGYIVHREMRRDAFETTAVGIGLPLLHEKSGGPCIVGFSSIAGKSTDIVHSERSPFVRAVELITWIDLGAGTPNG